MASFDYAGAVEGAARVVERPDGTKLHTISSGRGARTVLLAHGYGTSHQGWNVVVPLLVERGLRVITFDQRGHGESTTGTRGIGTRQMAADYGAILDAYEAENAVLVGHSMGGFLAIAFLLEDDTDAAERVGAVLLMATFAGDVNRKNPQNRVQIPLIKSGMMLQLLSVGAFHSPFTKTLVGDGFEPAMAEVFTADFRAQDHARLVPILEAMVNESRYDRLGELDLPCTIVVGSKDKTTPPFHTDDLHAGIAGSKLVKLPGKGHLLNWEAPEALVDEIVELASQVDG